MLFRWLATIKPAEHFDRAMQALLIGGGNLSMEYLARVSCLGLKQFERRCKKRIGLSPRIFARIARFSKAYRMREADPSISWTAIAHTAGYFDQMHLIRDFKVFTGTLPRAVDKELALTPWRLQAELLF